MYRKVLSIIVLLSTAAVISVPVAGAATGRKRAYARSEIVEVAKLTNPDLGPEAWFGPMDISGDTIVVGVPADDYLDLGDAGSAHVFVRTDDGWTLQQILIAPDRHRGDQFGCSVAISGGTLAIGALWDRGGSVYVFTRGTTRGASSKK